MNYNNAVEKFGVYITEYAMECYYIANHEELFDQPYEVIIEWLNCSKNVYIQTLNSIYGEVE